MSAEARLLAIKEIGKLKAAYFRCMDTKNWGEFPDLFTADAVFDVRGALEPPKSEEEHAKEPVVNGRAAIVEYVRSGISPLTSVHHGHMPEIEILSGTSAKGIWAMEDMLIIPPGGPFKKFQGWGHYFETYRYEGRWRIETLKLRRLYVEITA
ncbi:bile-acid 7-alpha-dehydratase [Acidocella aquatica]|uniref:Bile-acid 7-alpha-dehydratase n=1 Tax=Acidocella aquatica TaxID=1922313 RepID=A0ABQ6A756_9PROT|nr:nuclear transport factor 2 family protein [Acidocella aquatica]GLR67138.1 bile-acid 7-alpha-dehydratase [Acidocella aquatica]